MTSHSNWLVFTSGGASDGSRETASGAKRRRLFLSLNIPEGLARFIQPLGLLQFKILFLSPKLALPKMKLDSREALEPPLAAMTTETTVVIEVDEFGNLSLWQAIRKWKRVFLFSLGMSSAILMYGYDYVIVGNASAMPAFQYVSVKYLHCWPGFSGSGFR